MPTQDSGAVVSFDDHRAVRYIEDAFAGYQTDPADSDYQRGFLAALLVVYREGLGKGADDSRLALLDAQVSA